MSGPRIESIRWLKTPLDLALCALALLIAFRLAERGIPLPLSQGTPKLSAYLAGLPVYLVLFLFSAVFFRLYRPRRLGSTWGLAADVLKVNAQAALLATALIFYYRDFSFSRLILTSFYVLNTGIIFLHHLSWQWWEHHLVRRGIGARRCLVVGHGKLAAAIEQRLVQHPWLGLQPLGFVQVDDCEPVAVPGARIVGSLAELPRLIDSHEVHEIIVALPCSRMQVLLDLDAQLSQSTVGLQWTPDLEALNTLHREIVEIDDMHLINLRASRLRGFGRFLKRSFDIVGSALLLAVCLPLLGGIALAIRLTSHGPALFVQERVGRDGRVFRLRKFRTMVQDAERHTGPVFARENDARVTALGRFLRRSSLDELPQLWNVLLGEMSLVGPRPERPVFIEQFSRSIPSYMQRHRTRAGLTGWAQVHGLRGNTSLRERLQYDLYYLKNWSLWLDLKILALTLMRAWRRKWNSG